MRGNCWAGCRSVRRCWSGFVTRWCEFAQHRVAAFASRLAPTLDRIVQMDAVNCGSEPAREGVSEVA
ncbi:hypothetical protein DM828_25605 [Pseudomonas umsongensis]|nr:hypothetical protein [Pseudomonas umsongensis]